MQIHINSVHFPPSEALNTKIKDKLTRAFKRYPYIKEAKVFLRLQGNEAERQRVMEIRIPLPHGGLFVKSRAKTLYNALDKNMDKLKRQLEKHKEKAYAHN